MGFPLPMNMSLYCRIQYVYLEMTGVFYINGRQLHYFTTGNTARGFVELAETRTLKKIGLIGPSTVDKSNLLSNIADTLSQYGITTELVHNSLNAGWITAVIIPSLQISIIDGESDLSIDISEAYDSTLLAAKNLEINTLRTIKSESLLQAYSTFAEALAIHDEWEAIYIGNTDFDKLNAFTDSFSNLLFGDTHFTTKSNVESRFLGAATAAGAVDFVDNLTNGLQQRYLLKGRPGSGKSTLLKKIANDAKKRGINTEIYYCGFDPYSVDMVILRELGIAIFDSTAPHEYFPTLSGDEIIDLYEEAILPTTDTIFAKQIEQISARYSEKMAEAIEYLAEAKQAQDELEELVAQTFDFNKLMEIEQQLPQILFKGM